MVIGIVGDAALDVTVRPAGPMMPGGDTVAAIALGVGGQGANVAVRLARRGLAVRLVTALADDAIGAFIRSHLSDEGIEVAALPTERSPVVVALLDPAGERTLLSDRRRLTGGALGPSLLGVAWLHISGYVLSDADEAACVRQAVASLDPRPRLSVGGGSLREEPHVDVFRATLRDLAPDLLVLSRDEASAVLGKQVHRQSPSLVAIAESLAAPDRLAIVTGGVEGSAAAGWFGGPVRIRPTGTAALPVDATGAGDAYLAALVAEIVGVGWPPEAAVVRGAMRRAGKVGALVAGVSGAQGRIAGEPASPGPLEARHDR